MLTQLFFRTKMAVIMSVVNLTSLGCVTGQSTGLKLAAESVGRDKEVMAVAQQMRSANKPEQIFFFFLGGGVDCI